jgi:hypothetical protein
MACLRSAWTVATSGTDGSGTNRRRPESNETNGSGRQGRGAWQGSLDATGDTTDSRGDSCRTSAGSAIHGMVGETSSPQGRQQHDWQHVDRSTSRGQQQVDQRQGSILMHSPRHGPQSHKVQAAHKWHEQQTAAIVHAGSGNLTTNGTGSTKWTTVTSPGPPRCLK